MTRLAILLLEAQGDVHEVTEVFYRAIGNVEEVGHGEPLAVSGQWSVGSRNPF